jgi:hypothetical protein
MLLGEHMELIIDAQRATFARAPEFKAAAQNLSGFGARLALYFSDIVRNELPVEALTDVLGVHDKHLIGQVNA